MKVPPITAIASGILASDPLLSPIAVGNSPNINNNPMIGQTGIDTTATFLLGGRLGWRYGELKLGLSATYDKDNSAEVVGDSPNIARSELSAIPKIRFGGDE